MRVFDPARKGRAVVWSVAGTDQRLDHRLVPERLDAALFEAEVGKTDDLALVHRNAAEYLGEIFAKPDSREQLLGFAKATLLAHAPGISRHFLDRFHVCGEPGEAMGGVLFRLDLGDVELAVDAHSFADGGYSAFQQPFGGMLGLSGEVVERHREVSMFGAVALHNALPLRLLQCVFLASIDCK